jgi:pyruvate,water dikinase
MLNGIPASPGLASGRARIARNLEEAGDIENGEILIVDSPGLAWTPFLALAGGFVAQQQSDSPSAANLAREYGIPAVTGCAGVMEAAIGGHRIAVNGSEGWVDLKPR